MDEALVYGSRTRLGRQSTNIVMIAQTTQDNALHVGHIF